MLFKRRKTLFEVVCYEEGKDGVSMDEKSDCNGLQFMEVVCYEEGKDGVSMDKKSDCNGAQFMTIHKAILRNALKKAFDTDPDFGHQMADDIMLVVHAALEERMEDPRDL